jgi:hypothetical protein
MHYQSIQKLNQKFPVLSFFTDLAKSYFALKYYFQAFSLTLRSTEEKRDYLRKWQKATGYKVFVETGTYQGRTTVQMAQIFERCFTVEVDPGLHAQATERFAGVANISSYLGDSPAILPEILAQIHQPAIFWLDAHDSRGATSRSAEDSPIGRELSMVFAHSVKNHVILIDDARNFCGVFGYPSIRQLHRFVKKNSDYYMHINQDVIAIHPYEL